MSSIVVRYTALPNNVDKVLLPPILHFLCNVHVQLHFCPGHFSRQSKHALVQLAIWKEIFGKDDSSASPLPHTASRFRRSPTTSGIASATYLPFPIEADRSESAMRTHSSVKPCSTDVWHRRPFPCLDAQPRFPDVSLSLINSLAMPRTVRLPSSGRY